MVFLSNMPASMSGQLSLVAMALGAVFLAYIPARRPRERSSWAIAAAAAGLLIYYLCDFILYRTGISLEAVFFWEKMGLLGTGVAAIAAVAVALSLRDTPIPRWEQILAVALVVRAVVDMIHIATEVPQPQPSCILPAGVPGLDCGPVNQITSALALVCIVLTFWLFVRTFRLASDGSRRVLVRYILPAALLVCIAMGTNLIWGMLPRGPGIPTAVLMVPAAALLASGLLRLEQHDRGLRLSWPVQAAIAWVLLLILSVVADTWLVRAEFPVVSMVTILAGLAGSVAYLAGRVAVLERAAHAAQPVLEPPRAGPEQEASAAATAEARVGTLRLHIHLFGPFRVERDGVLLPDDARFWRSDKSKSLLAYLVLAGNSGATRNELVDALWPIGEDGDGDAERLSINAVRSYLSTVRKVLEPERPRNKGGIIRLEGGRYYFRATDDVRVDVWEFERLADRAEQLARAGRPGEAAEAWEQAIGLHGELGLLPDEIYLPAGAVEPERERLRLRAKMGLRWLAGYYAQHGPVERAAMVWETIWRESPFDHTAYQWLAAHYAASGRAEQLERMQQQVE